MQPSFQSYIICTTPRSGSTLLCGLLAGTSVAGKPESYFHVPSLERWMTAHALQWDAYSSDRDRLHAVFDAAQESGRDGTDLFGLRLQRDSFEYFMSQLAVLYPEPSEDKDRIEAAFGPTLFIHLTRREKLAQAISRLKAEQTGLWHRSADGRVLERTTKLQEAAYDPAAIKHHIDNLSALDDAWVDWFAQTGIRPHSILYEDLADHPLDVLAQVLDALGLDQYLARSVDIPTSRLSDAISQDWASRYRRDHRD